ncbi:hypothetical protein ACFVTP_13720 [Streptomyces celluloflavus]|uniref:hypothetical protein n=1 Tax=Streptomyces celluloflavus TaxID=58344 RepID=UPI0036DEB6FB
MDSKTVRTCLREAGVADDFYRIEGVHEPQAPATELYTLRHRADHWEVVFTERGQESILARYTAETQAAQCLYQKLTDPLS